MEDDVGPVRERLLEEGRREGVVDDEQRLMRVRNHGGGRQVGDLHQRIRRRFDEYRLRIGGAGILDVLHVGGVDVREREAQMLQKLVEEPEGSAVYVCAADDMICLLYT